MISLLSKLFRRSDEDASSHGQVDQPANSPLEILVPQGAELAAAPSLAGKVMSYFVASSADINTLEYSADAGRFEASDEALKQFLTLVAGAKQSDNLLSQCASVFYEPRIAGSVGDLACIQQSTLYCFAVFEMSPYPTLKWEIHRWSRPVQLAP